jgi:nicotinamide-nucleotide amidase
MSTITSRSSDENPGRVSILAIGNELLKGDIADKNAAFLAKELRAIGLKLVSISMCNDNLDIIKQELERLSNQSEMIFTSGGLGPTSDDMTKEAISSWMGVELVEDEQSRQRLEQYYQQRARPVTENALSQVVFPKGAQILENLYGTADSFISLNKQKNCWLIALPGVPSEVRGIFESKCKALLTELFPQRQVLQDRRLRLFGLSESYVGSLLNSIDLPRGVELAYRPSFPELMLVISSTSEAAESQQFDLLNQSANLIVDTVGAEYFYCLDGQESLTQTVASLLAARNLSISAAESCSGGQFAHSFVSLPGSSEYFKGAIVSYSNEAKQSLLGVSKKTIETYGAVSKDCAEEMALGALRAFSSDYSIAITGIAGPEGGSEEKPVGRVHIAVASKNKDNVPKVFSCQFDMTTWSRNYLRTYTVILATDLLRRTILNLPTTWERK